MNALFAIDNATRDDFVLVSGIEKVAEIAKSVAPIDNTFYKSLSALCTPVNGRTRYFAAGVRGVAVERFDDGLANAALQNNHALAAVLPDEIALALRRGPCIDFEIDPLVDVMASGPDVVFFVGHPNGSSELSTFPISMAALLHYSEVSHD